MAVKDEGGAAAPSQTLKEQGNAEFKAGNYLRAAALYTQAIKADPSNFSLYSNRSVSFLHLSKVTKALADAEKTIELNPSWEKGYYRKGCALEALTKYDEAADAFREAAHRNPDSREVAAKLRAVQKLLGGGGSGSSGRRSPDGADAGGGGEQLAGLREEVRAYADSVLAAAAAAWSRDPAGVSASVSLLPRSAGGGEKAAPEVVSIKEAFQSPDTLHKCVSFLRDHAAERGVVCACLVAPRRDIAFPQVWRERGAKSWEFGDREGLLVQVDTAGSVGFRQMWFVASPETGQRQHSKREISPLEYDIYAIMPPILR